ncbi:unnamed protein product [Diplocarpon coronariae]
MFRPHAMFLLRFQRYCEEAMRLDSTGQKRDKREFTHENPRSHARTPSKRSPPPPAGIAPVSATWIAAWTRGNEARDPRRDGQEQQHGSQQSGSRGEDARLAWRDSEKGLLVACEAVGEQKVSRLWSPRSTSSPDVRMSGSRRATASGPLAARALRM